ncbi:unnamed protein product, partial [Hapterophycus canaliculatus]
MSAVGRVLCSAARGRCVGPVSRPSYGGSGAPRYFPAAAAAPASLFSTEGASLRKVFQAAAKGDRSQPQQQQQQQQEGKAAASDASNPSSPSPPPKPTPAIVRGVTGVPPRGDEAGKEGEIVGQEESERADASEDARHVVSSTPDSTTTATEPPAPGSALPFHQGNYMEFAPRITVIGCGGAGGNAVSNMIARNLKGVEFMVCNTDAQHLSTTLTDNRLQLGKSVTEGLGCGANPDAGRKAAEESKEEILEMIEGSHMVFITAGMGGGTGTGAAPVIAEACLEAGILTVAVVTKPFRFEGNLRMRLAEEGLRFLASTVDTLIVIPNQNLFQMVDKQTSLLDSFR